MITNELLDVLERRYLTADQQKCVVCGAPLSFSASGNDSRYWSRYNCSSDAVKPGTGPGLRERLAHYEASAWYDRGQADPGVVELVRAYRNLTQLPPDPHDLPYPGPGNPCPHDGGKIAPGFRCAACAKEDRARIIAGRGNDGGNVGS